MSKRQSLLLRWRKKPQAITQRNLSIQGMRGVAALFVVLFHASVFSGHQFGESGNQNWSYGCAFHS